jgi:hypothetical protein
MINPSTVIFAIQAGLKLATKVRQIAIDKTSEKPLVTPAGLLVGDELESAASHYFDKHPELAPANEADQVKAYQTIMQIESGATQNVREMLKQLGPISQVKAGTGSRPALQRLLGTVAEIAVDYFTLHPDKLGKNQGSRQVLAAFISRLDEVEFSEAMPRDLIEQVMHASLSTLGDRVTLIDDDDRRVQVLIGGVTQALLGDYDQLIKASDQMQRGQLIKRISSSVMRGGAAAFTGNVDLFMPGDAKATLVVKSTLSGIVKGIEGKEDLFTNESLELIYQSALVAVAENSTVFTDDALLSSMIKNTVTALTSKQAQAVFGQETVSAIVQAALATVTENIETLVDVDSPEKQVLADAVTALANGLGQKLAGKASARELLSKKQLVELTSLVFAEVARHPEQLLHRVGDDELKTVLAQIVGSTAKALGEDPQRLVNGASYVTLVQAALKTGLLNADKLLDLDTTKVSTNILYQVIKEAADAVSQHPDPRRLVSREVFVTTVTGILPIVSANLDPLLGKRVKEPVKTTIRIILDQASSGALENFVNGANLAPLIEQMLLKVLREELATSDTAAVIATAKIILKTL